MKIGIIGSGHVGLVTGACFSDLGNDVMCMDEDIRKIKLLQKGSVPFYESGLLELVQKNRRQGRLKFTTQMSEVIRFAKVIFLCVGTPPRADGDADLSAIKHVAKEIGKNLTAYRLIVEKSTVPVATGTFIYEAIKSNRSKKVSFDVACNAEFLREGSAVQDFFKPDRIIIGAESKKAKRLLTDLYAPFKVPMVLTDVRSAEMIKHASNSFLAMKISYINLISQMCEKTGANISKVAEGMGKDHRIGRSFLNAGIGFGGSCFPKDLTAFIRVCEKLNLPSNLLKDVFKINEQQKAFFTKKVRKVLGTLKGKRLGVLGLSFKPDTDDMRNAPSLDILKHLRKANVKIAAYDPRAMMAAKESLPWLKFAKNAYEACSGADAVLILTEWHEFRELDLNRLKKILNQPIVIDGRNVYDPVKMGKMGFQYYSIGR